MHYVGNAIAQIDAAAEYQDNATKLATVTGLLADVESTGQRHHEPALYRLKGELVLDVTRDDTAAEACFQQAIEVAARQGAKLPELQATLSMARLWRRRGHTSDAHAALEQIYPWFTEGLDTSDLQDARALLDDLAGR
jgi:predicted ATPase